MRITSLSRRTDLIFAKFSGNVTDKGNYTLVQTPSNPGFHWGNYVVFDAPPKAGDYKRWKEIFEKKFTYYNKISHMVFTWESNPPSPGEYQEFIDNGFEFDEGVVLSTNELISPSKYNQKIEIRKITTDKEWEDAIQIQVLCSDPKFVNAGYESFKRKQFAQYRAMSEKEMGNWFGAYIDGQIVGDLGIFFEEELGRFQNVGTHPEFRRQGICQTLVYETAQIALKEYGVSTLVMEADANYHAAKIYESVGFKPTEKNFALSWWKDHG
jgi:ribosomal protein S18 acetylase RimI-like enzyme